MLEGSTSENENVRYFSANYMRFFFKHRDKILERYGVDPYQEYFKFSHDPSTTVRKQFIYGWPQTGPLAGAPEEMTRQFLTLLQDMAKNDHVPEISSMAQRYFNFYPKAKNAPVQKD